MARGHPNAPTPEPMVKGAPILASAGFWDWENAPERGRFTDLRAFRSTPRRRGSWCPADAWNARGIRSFRGAVLTRVRPPLPSTDPPERSPGGRAGKGESRHAFSRHGSWGPCRRGGRPGPEPEAFRSHGWVGGCTGAPHPVPWPAPVPAHGSAEGAPAPSGRAHRRTAWVDRPRPFSRPRASRARQCALPRPPSAG